VNGALLQPDGQRALSWSADNTLRLWDLATGQQIGPAMVHDDAVLGVRLLDGQRALSWSADKTLRLWNLATGQQIGPAMTREDKILGALVLAHSGRALSWSADHMLRLWDLATGRQIGSAMPHDAVIKGALLLSDGQRALSWSDDKTLRLWNINWPTANNLVELGCRLVEHDEATDDKELQHNHGLSAFAERYGIKLEDPICQPGVAIPSPTWSISQ
ncbi:WD40 repeat domain-containing protein, partial [Labrys miyagiensis]|uniref:WD40 repeat domain-containing protein n=1 Tax=Labrys miyagiensis TaxID=346912 RepID=UPI003D66CBA0